MDKSKKGGFFRGMLDGFRSSVGSQSSPSHSSTSDKQFGSRGDHQEMEDNIKPEHFEILEVVRHGFPYQPTALAFDPIQRVIAIGTKSGSMRILGRPGVDINVQHVPGHPVIQIMFLINEGSVITVCADDSLHLWDLKQKQPTILHSLKFQRERITYCHLPFQSKWLYIGTERGNVYISNVESFMLSGYVINWNKVIELSRKTHPGCIIHLSNCPIDPNKLLIGYDSGFIVIWDLRNKCPDTRITYTEGLASISWHHEGRQYVCSHTDGSITTWNLKSTKPASVAYPHAKTVTEALKPEPCKPVLKVEWRTVRNGDSFIIFSGGLPYSSSNSSTPGTPSSTTATTSETKSSKQHPSQSSSMSTQSLTVIHGKTTTVLEMEHNIIDFVTLCECPWESDFNEPYAIVVLLYNDLVVVDLTSPGYPCFQNPYTMDLHESPITYVAYFADCPSDLIPAFYSVGQKGNTKRSGFSEKEWPINGGEWGTATLSYPEVIATGHADGTLKFWDASSVNLHLLYKLKTSKLFQKPKGRPPVAGSSQENPDPNEDPFAIEHISFCTESRILCIAGASSHVVVFRFNRQEIQSDISVIEVVMKHDICESEKDSLMELETAQGISGLLRHQGSSEDSHGNSASLFFPLSVKSGSHKRPSGFQPELVCLSPWLDNSTPPYKITSLTINSSNSLLAYGTENGLIVIDLIQKAIVLNVASPELYGAADPYQRYVKSPKKNTANTAPKDSSDGNQSDPDRCKSPTSDQCSEACSGKEPSTPSSPVASSYREKLPENVEAGPIPPPRCKRRTKESSGRESRELLSSVDNESKSVDLPEIAQNCELNSEEACNENAERLARPTELKLKLAKTQSLDSEAILAEKKEISSSEASLNDNSDRRPSLSSQSNGSKLPSPTEAQPAASNEDGTRNPCPISKAGCQKLSKEWKRRKTKFIDLREEKEPFAVAKLINKIESSFSRSRSSSVSSIDNITTEPIQCLYFAETYNAKGESSCGLCLWLGTTLGSIIVISITLPDTEDNRILCLQSVLAIPTGNIFRLKGSILCVSFLDNMGSLMTATCEQWKDSKTGSRSGGEDKRSGSFTISRSSSGGPTNFSSRSKISPTSSSADMRDSQFVVLVSEKHARVLSLPGQVCLSKATLSETSFTVRADVIQMKTPESVCLAAYLGTGNIVVFSLPSLKPLIDIDFLPLVDVRIARTLTFSTNGHGIYLSSASEIQKFCLSSSLRDIIPEMLGNLYLAKELPEAPKLGFFKGLFSGGTSMLDREELFGEASGKSLKGTARLIPGSQSGLEQAKAQSGSLAGEMAKVRQGLTERGENLERLEERTARMMQEGEGFRDVSHQLLLKYKDKKWYQF